MGQSPEVAPACMRGEGAALQQTSLSLSQGFVSWRDPNSGSWYIETLDRVFEQWAHSDDLQSLLLRVSGAFLQGGGGCWDGQCVLHRAGWWGEQVDHR